MTQISNDELIHAVKANDYAAVAALIQQGADINADDDAALMWAIQQNHYDLAELLLKNGAQANDRAVIQASKHGHYEIVQLLLDQGASADAQKSLAVVFASENGHLRIVQLLLAKGAAANSLGSSALIEASKKGHYDIVKLLLDKGAQADDRQSDALVWASRFNRYDMVKLLIAYGAQPNDQQNAALISASEHGFYDLAKLLLKYGADATAQKSLALIRASTFNHYAIVELLLESGALVHDKDDSAIIMASTFGNIEIVKLLLTYGASANAQESLAVVEASENGYYDIVQLLLNHGATVNNSRQLSPALVGASKNGHYAIVELLLAKDAHVNAATGQPLILASEAGHYDIVNLLIDHGANIQLQNNKALQMAAKNNRLNIVTRLLEHYTHIRQHQSIAKQNKIYAAIIKSIQLANTNGYIRIVRVLVDYEHISILAKIITIPYKPTDIIRLIKYAYYGFVPWTYLYKNKPIIDFVRRALLSPNQTFADYINSTMDNWFYSRLDMKNFFNNQNQQLSLNDRIKVYSHHSDRIVNAYLRNNSEIDTTVNNPDNIDVRVLYLELLQAFSLVKPLGQAIRVFRGLVEYGHFRFNQIHIGQTYTELGFTSTTMRCCADEFMSSGKSILITFVIPAGARVLFLSNKFGNSVYEEYEVLLAPGLTYEIIDKQVIDKKHTLFVKIVGYME